MPVIIKPGGEIRNREDILSQCLGDILVGPGVRSPLVRFPSCGSYVRELGLFEGYVWGRQQEQRNPKGGTDLRETKEVEFTKLGPNWMTR